MSETVEALGIFEVTGFTPAMVGLDAMEKGAQIRVVQAELNDFLGTVIKIEGSVANVRAALACGEQAALRMGAKPLIALIPRPDSNALSKGIMSKQERSPLLDQNVVLDIRTSTPTEHNSPDYPLENTMTSNSHALGFIETQGFTAVFEAIDAACKSANVEVVAKEKLGGGYITVVIRGDVAAVSAAIESGKAKVEGLGKLIAAHVIARPSAQVMSLLPK